MKKVIVTGAVLATINQHGDRSFAGFIGNFSKLKSACEAMGISYDPSNPLLALTALVIILDALYDKNKAVIDLLTPYKAALISRNAAYEIMSVMKTQILNALKSSKNVTAAEVLIATNLGKKVDGVRIMAIKTTTVPPVVVSVTEVGTEADVASIERHSVSFQKFEIRLNNFLIFFSYVTGLTCYSTNNIALQLPAIQAYYDSLPLLNASAQLTVDALNLARQERNDAFFKELIGARHLATQVKNYISSEFTTKSAEFISVKSIPFPDFRPKNKK